MSGGTVPVRCRGCRRQIGLSADVEVRVAIYCREICMAYPGATPTAERNSLAEALVRFEGQLMGQVAARLTSAADRPTIQRSGRDYRERRARAGVS